ncbi:MAG: DUF3293 domain-containing protein [Pseudomonadota bacterium]|nr:DUF3293 domain-containing protein [Pseudomonadota bacterium]
MPRAPHRLAELLAAYVVADYRWQRDGHWFPLVVGQRAPGIDDAFPVATHFAALSAWNPDSVPQHEHINRAADEALQAALEDSGFAYRPAFAAARNRSWKESSWLVVGMPVGEFDALSRRFGQLGTLCWQRGQPVRLRMDASRPATVSDHASVDWLK